MKRGRKVKRRGRLTGKPRNPLIHRYHFLDDSPRDPYSPHGTESVSWFEYYINLKFLAGTLFADSR
jgi:hypothetical protein